MNPKTLKQLLKSDSIEDVEIAITYVLRKHSLEETWKFLSDAGIRTTFMNDEKTMTASRKIKIVKQLYRIWGNNGIRAGIWRNSDGYTSIYFSKFDKTISQYLNNTNSIEIKEYDTTSI